MEIGLLQFQRKEGRGSFSESPKVFLVYRKCRNSSNSSILYSDFHDESSLLAILYEELHGAVHRLSPLTFIDNVKISTVGTETLCCTTKKVFKTRCLASNFLLDFSRSLR